MKLFLSYNFQDNAFVSIIAQQLAQSGFEVYHATTTNNSGDDWLQEVQKSINNSHAALIFIGEYGIGPWQSKEIIKIISDCTKNEGYRIIPIIVPANNKFINYALPWFVADYQWIEFKDAGDHEAFSKLLDGIRKENPISPTGKNPYKGLESFGIGDAYCFFGRTYHLNLVFHSKLRLHVGKPDNNFLAVVGNSGVGKSSFVKAGILASLKGGKFTGSDTWRQWIIKPGYSPLTALSAQLKLEGLITDSRLFEENALLHEDEFLRTIRDQQEIQVIFIDQFEEVVIQCRDEQEKKAFLNNIARAAETGKAIILLALRSDFYTSFSPYPLFKSLLERNNYTLPGMDAEEQDDESYNLLLREIVVRPAADAGVKMDEKLVNTLLYDIRNVKGVLPVLELTLDLLWKNRSGNTKIMLEDYAIVSQNRNLAGIIQIHADSVFSELTNNGTDKRKTELFRKIFVPCLVEVSANREDVRRTALKKELTNISGYNSSEAENMIIALSSERSRLLTTHDAGDATTVEVAHEVVIREWPLLKQWINERRDALAYLEKIRNDAEEFDGGRGERYRGRKLWKAKSWAKNNPDLLNKSINNLIAQSKVRIRNFLLTLAGITIVLSVSAAILYKPYMRWRFINGVKSIPSLQEQIEGVGSKADSLKTLSINEQSISYIKNKLDQFENLDTIEITNLSDQKIPAFNIRRRLKKIILSENRKFTDLTGIEKFQSVTSLEITGNGMIDNIKQIKHLQSLTTLVIKGNANLTTLQGIEYLKSLKYLEISGNATLNNISEINKLDSLKVLSISAYNLFNDLSFNDLSFIKNLVNLESLTIAGNSEFLNLDGLENLKVLTSLDISNNRKISNLQGLKNFRSLRSLVIQGNPNLLNINGIDYLDSLKHVEISYCDKLKDLRKIENLKNLNSLEIISNAGLVNLKGIEVLHHLESLRISKNAKLTGLREIQVLTRLKNLTIEEVKRTTNLKFLSSLQSLSSLIVNNNDDLISLSGIEELPLSHLVISGNDKLNSLEPIKDMQTLTSLEVTGNEKLFSLDEIQYLHSLKALKISFDTLFTSLSKIRGLKHLTSLEISTCNLMTLEGIGGLSSLTSLQILFCDKLSSLAGIENAQSLNNLDLAHNKDLENLQGISQLKSLRRIYLTGSARVNSMQHIYELENLDTLNIWRSYAIDYNRLRKKNPLVKIIQTN